MRWQEQLIPIPQLLHIASAATGMHQQQILSNSLAEHSLNIDFSKPYPFYLAYALDDEPQTLGEPHEWQAEWKWDGIRGQMIKRNDELFVWSRGEELITEKFPEYQILQTCLPNGTVLDGEILSFEKNNDENSKINGGVVLPFALLQTRIGRKNVTRKQLQDAPVAFFAYDILELNGEDIRNKTLQERRIELEKIVEQVKQSFAAIISRY